jgi:putative two-component system response regulator
MIGHRAEALAEQARDRRPQPAPSRIRSPDVIGCVAGLAKARNNGLAAHVTRVGDMTKILARAVGLPHDYASTIGQAATLHDAGKIAIPDSILCKPGPLDASEWALMKQHPKVGHDLLRAARHPLLDTAAALALFHHECFDGSGYPSGFGGDAIPIEARIVSVCDIYDALREVRSYRPAFDHEKACDVILKGDGRTTPAKFDPDVLMAFDRVKEELDRVIRATPTATY